MFLGRPPGQGHLQNCAVMSACRSHPLDFKVQRLFALAEDGTSLISREVLRSGSTGGANGNVWPHSHDKEGARRCMNAGVS